MRRDWGRGGGGAWCWRCPTRSGTEAGGRSLLAGDPRQVSASSLPPPWPPSPSPLHQCLLRELAQTLFTAALLRQACACGLASQGTSPARLRMPSREVWCLKGLVFLNSTNAPFSGFGCLENGVRGCCWRPDLRSGGGGAGVWSLTSRREKPLVASNFHPPFLKSPQDRN